MADFTQADLDALNDAIASGARRVSYNGQTVEYRDMSEMLRARQMIRNALGVTKTTRTSRAAFRRGTE